MSEKCAKLYRSTTTLQRHSAGSNPSTKSYSNMKSNQ